MADQEQQTEQSVEQELADIYANIDSALDEANIKPDETEEESSDQEEQETENQDESEAEDDTDQNDQDAEDDTDNQDESESDDKDDSDVPQAEQEARAKGWRPKSEWQGDPDQWVDFGEFNRRTELFDKISGQNKTIKALNKKLDALIKHNQGLETKTREKVIAELEAKRKEAVKYGDEEAFEAVEQELEEAKKSKSVFDEEDSDEETESEDKDESKDVPQDVEIPQPIKDFASRNSTWFEKDQEMTDFAVFKVQQYTNKGLSLPEALEKAEKEVKSTYAAKFKNPNKDKPSSVMSGSKESRPKKASINSLTPEQKQVWHTLKGVMSPEEFLEQLEDIG